MEEEIEDDDYRQKYEYHIDIIDEHIFVTMNSYAAKGSKNYSRLI